MFRTTEKGKTNNDVNMNCFIEARPKNLLQSGNAKLQHI